MFSLLYSHHLLDPPPPEKANIPGDVVHVVPKMSTSLLVQVLPLQTEKMQLSLMPPSHTLLCFLKGNDEPENDQGEDAIPPKYDMTQRADILVTEIFDSALTGEGILPFLRQVRQISVPKSIIAALNSSLPFSGQLGAAKAASRHCSKARPYLGASSAARGPGKVWVGG